MNFHKLDRRGITIVPADHGRDVTLVTEWIRETGTGMATRAFSAVKGTSRLPPGSLAALDPIEAQGCEPNIP